MAKGIDLERASELWKSGMKITEMCRLLGTTEKTFQAIKKGCPPEYFPPRKSAIYGLISEDEIKIAKEMWDSGSTYAEIGDRLGRSKGSISGLMSRNRSLFPERFGELKKVSYSAKSIAKEVREKTRVEKLRSVPSANKLRQIFHEALNPTPPPKPKEQWSEYDQSRMPGVSLVDLDTRKCCRWPILDTFKGQEQMFCGEVKAGKNYCQNHQERAWRAA